MSTLKVNEVTNLGGGVPEGVGGFTASTTITATDSSFPVPALGSPIVKVTVIGGGGGGGGTTGGGALGGNTIFDAAGAGSITAEAGKGGRGGGFNNSGQTGHDGFASGNGGSGGKLSGSGNSGTAATGGAIKVAYLDLSGISTVAVTIGAGGTPGDGNRSGGVGGRGEVILEFVAG